MRTLFPSLLPINCSQTAATSCIGLSEMATSLGTMRVTTESGKLFVSADLYCNDAASFDDPPIGQIPPLGPGVLIFPIADYSYYLRFTKSSPRTAASISPSRCISSSRRRCAV